MSTLHGECSPQTLQNLLHIPAADAKRYVTQLVAEGVIKAHPLLNQSVSHVAQNNHSGVLDKIKQRLDMKRQNLIDEQHTSLMEDTTPEPAPALEFDDKVILNPDDDDDRESEIAGDVERSEFEQEEDFTELEAGSQVQHAAGDWR